MKALCLNGDGRSVGKINSADHVSRGSQDMIRMKNCSDHEIKDCNDG